MKVRGTIASTPLSATLTALCWGALALLAPVALSACTSSTSTTPPTVFSPSVSGTATVTATASGDTSPSGSTSTPGVTATATATASPATPEVTVTQTVTVSPGSIPPAAPVTGGGGTAGFQDTLLLALGAAAILAGAGGLAYRRWLGRGR